MTPVYTLPLYVDIYVGGNVQRYAVEIDEVFEEFEFAVAEEPSLVVFDAEKQLLGEITFEKNVEELVFQYRNTEKFLSRYEAVTSFVEHVANDTIRKVVFEAMDDPFWGIRQEAVAAFADYTGPDQDKIVSKLKEMGLHDESSLVRADAIATLATLNPDEHKEVFKQDLKTHPTRLWVPPSLVLVKLLPKINKKCLVSL